ncbi:MAG: HAMP domain-containing histidine kinase [Firmicutes bacterium]|nr:HAMP domain-containing histidine kinase [Bacillota bacterium]
MFKWELLRGKLSKWLRSVKVPLFLGLAVLYFISSVMLSEYFFKIWQNYWINQRVTEANRYISYLAGEISTAENSSGEVIISPGSRFQSLSRIYSYMRVLILDSKAKVVQDTTQSRIGRYIVNDEVIQALGGQTVQGGDQYVRRIAVPIKAKSDNAKVQGVIYAFASMDSVHQSLEVGRERTILVTTLIGFITMALAYALVYLLLRPLSKILAWLRDLKDSETDVDDLKKPVIHGKNEFTMIVDEVEDVTHDLLALDRSRKEFVSNVSHELKTPLSSIKVLTESLLLQDGVPEELYKEFLQDINSEIDRMNGIVSDLLTLVRLEEGENVLNLSTFSIGDMTDDIIKRMKPLADQRGIHLVLEEVHPAMIEADETKLTLALTNLIQNGIKYNKDGGQVKVRIDCNQVYALIVVSDTGIGIEEKNYEKLFQRFYRVDKARNREAGGTGGTGLGLSIVRQIVTLHKGTISVSSVLGEGSSFSIKMPLVQTADTEEEE